MATFHVGARHLGQDTGRIIDVEDNSLFEDQANHRVHVDQTACAGNFPESQLELIEPDGRGAPPPN